MRILFLAHRLPYPPNKGDKIRSFWMLQNLARRGNVDLFCFYDDDRDVQYVPELRKLCSAVYVERISPLRARVRAATAFLTGRPFSLGYFHSASMRTRIAEAIKQQHYDFIFIFCTSMAQYLPATGVPAVLDMVDVDSDKWAQYAKRRRSAVSPAWRLEAKRLSAFEQQICGRFRSVLLCTKREVKLLTGGKDDSTIICVPNRFDLDYFDSRRIQVPDEIQRLRPFIVFTGQMDYFPNVDAVQYFHGKILPEVLRARPELKFVIVGRNPNLQAKRLAKYAPVRVTGEVPDVRPYLKAAEVAVLPLRIARGVQNKALEALAMGVPVVASTRVCEAMPEPVARFIQRADDPHDFAVSTLAAMREKQDSLADIRSELSAHYGTEGLRQQLSELIDQCMGNGTSPGTHTDLAPTRGRA